MITGDELRPDLLLNVDDKCLYVLELTVGFESNLDHNRSRKEKKYREMIINLKYENKKVRFINLSISALGIFGESVNDFNELFDELKFDTNYKKYIIMKIIKLCIRSSY